MTIGPNEKAALEAAFWWALSAWIGEPGGYGPPFYASYSVAFNPNVGIKLSLGVVENILSFSGRHVVGETLQSTIIC